ncbi:uncharacterized protein LOC116255632 isoform X2 [Nymphaea colorata]|uniref:uncharacterized protein LOC116255632 isoform X2 n=1 Tax=Nymphaea colorata TaxID=210225 RepID=UPI00129DA19A|nr:uncharacterized protein LOC116255632 isoform X2 [Nymphaea colorata]
MAGLRQKLDHVVRLHEESKSAFRILESHIKAGLLEAEEIFASLSVPLMRLVDLKSKEMAVEGRSCTIVVKDSVCKDAGKVASGAESESRRIAESEERRFNQLISFLRTTESTVNSHLEAIHQRLANRRSSLHKAHQAIVSRLANASQEAAASTPLLLAINVQRATFRSFDGALLSVGGEVQSAICRMAEDVCRPLLGLAREMKADGVAEASRRLMAAVVEMEAVVTRRGVELEEARRRIQAEEEANRSARKRLADCEREVRNLRQKVEAWEQGFCRSFQDRVGGAAQHHAAEKHQFLDDKLLWQLLKDGQRHADDFNRGKLISPLANHTRRTISDLGAEEDHDHHVKHAGAAAAMVANGLPESRSSNGQKKAIVVPRDVSSSADLRVNWFPAVNPYHSRTRLPATPTLNLSGRRRQHSSPSMVGMIRGMSGKHKSKFS